MFKRLNEKVRSLDVFDIGLIKGALFVSGIAIAKIFPDLLHARFRVLLVIIIILAARPTYRYFAGK